MTEKTEAQGGKLLWCDLETTGLDPNACKILEVALVVTDGVFLEPIDEWSSVISYRGQVAGHVDPFVEKMHTQNGLWNECAADGAPGLLAVEEAACSFIVKHFDAGPEKPVLCGNSIHFDRSFIKRHLPRVESFLHYRMVDVSTLKVLADRWGYPLAPKPEYPNQAHRAALDIAASIDELKFYQTTFISRMWERRLEVERQTR